MDGLAGLRALQSLGYQSEWGDHLPQLRQAVMVHRLRQAGQTPPVSKVFQEWPHWQNQTLSGRGVQPQWGQRMRPWPEVSAGASAEVVSGVDGSRVVRAESFMVPLPIQGSEFGGRCQDPFDRHHVPRSQNRGLGASILYRNRTEKILDLFSPIGS